MNCARLLVLGKRGLRNVSRNGLLGMLPGRRSHYHMHVIGGASERLLLVSKAHELRVSCGMHTLGQRLSNRTDDHVNRLRKQSGWCKRFIKCPIIGHY